ncbi:Basic leucine zipper and W2 domain-containing protein 2 [Clydaea vesicula]|uniref:Basic leucine zipper and W2 domain-containing protein 2 n=1 Tax=Clydaea vesicula TaxID=447962 RepID=A0AAD5U2X6_9FUNG|nr:Basic leucine zipper and W2 domain-containing protein 2 [Clydaea vesicula]
MSNTISNQTTDKKKPALATQFKVKQRKRENVTKFDPQTFRDNFFELLIDENRELDLEKYSNTLELPVTLEKLEIKRYSDSFFEVLIVGALLAPGGTVVDDDKRRNPFSIFSGENSREDIRSRVEVINKVVRRHKYLQVKLDDSLIHLLQYINKLNPEDRTRFATACAVALDFVTSVFRSYLEESNYDSLDQNLKKSGIGAKLMEFFPPTKRTEKNLIDHFEAEGLKVLVTHHKKLQEGRSIEVAKDKLKEMFLEEVKLSEVVNYAKQQASANSWSEVSVVSILWDSLISAIDWGTKQEQIEVGINKSINYWGKIFLPFCTVPKTEISFLLKLQAFFYEDARFMKYFVKVLQIFYKLDVLSDSAIIYWHDKGHSQAGKTVFLKQTEAFVSWLKTLDDEESEED